MYKITPTLDRVPETFTSALSPSISSSSVMTIDTEEYTKANDCLSFIKDPLWLQVCREIITMMGPASLLKIWNSQLGEVSSNGKAIDIHCHNKETSDFVQQYAFVILGCLQPYFPTVKKLNVKTIDFLT